MDMKTSVSNEELLALTKKAFDNDEVAEFLCGEKEYTCPLNRFVPANVPTDFGRIVNLGVYRLYMETQNEEIIKKFKKAILSLLNGNAVQIWVAYSVCWNLIYKKNHNKPTIIISDNKFWETVKSSVQKNEDKLRLCKEWQGFNLENGLWEDIKRMDKNLTADGGVYFEQFGNIFREENKMIFRRGNYSENTVEMILNQIKFGRYFDGPFRWYAGVTANVPQSLAAHGFAKEEIYARACWDFVCWDIKNDNALRCKKEVIALYDNLISDDESDFLSEKYPNLYIYFFKVTEERKTHSDTSGFTPVKALPETPIWVTEKARNGSVKREIYDHSLSDEELKALLEHCREVFLNGTLNTLVIQHRSMEEMWFNFGEGCCRISYDAHTSQEGGYASWRNGSKARKAVKFFEGEYPEYMVCRDVERYMAALTYFLEKDRKPGKRQNVQWAWINEDKFPKNK